MKADTAERMVRLYPAAWRERYGAEFAAVLEDHPFSFGTLMNVLRNAAGEHLNSIRFKHMDLSSMLWCAWMLALAVGLVLCGVVDESGFVAAIQGDPLLRVVWTTAQAGAVAAAFAISLGGLASAYSVFRYALAARRLEILSRLALPVLTGMGLVAWGLSVMSWTGGQGRVSLWISNPRMLPPEIFRWITGFVSTALLFAVLVVSGVSVAQVRSRAEFPDLAFAPGAKITLTALRLAMFLTPLVAATFALVFAGALLWSVTASSARITGVADQLGPLRLSTSTSWWLSSAFFGASAVLALRSAWGARHLRVKSEVGA